MKTHLKTKIKHAVFALALQGSPPGDHDRTKRGRNPLVPAPNYLIGAFDLQNYTALKYNCF